MSFINLINITLIKCELRNRRTYSNSANGSITMTLFKGLVDRFNGITVNSSTENCDINVLPLVLEESLKAWKEANRRGIWFKVGIQHTDWIPILVKHGFIFHHAKSDFVMLRKWISEELDITPQYAHTMVGVGAVVIKEADEVLVVKERYGYTEKWKLPGGYAEPGENIVDTAIREVYEETNISTAFESILNVRHAHDITWDCSDLYFVVSLKPLTMEISKCEREIKDAKWMKIDEYLHSTDIHELNKFFVQTYLDCKHNSILVDCKHSLHPVFKKPYTVYFARTKNK